MRRAAPPSPATQAVLVGRDEELARVRSAIAAARSGRSEVVVLVGPAGIGKTSLLRAPHEHAEDVAAVTLEGVEQEADLPYGTLHRLVAPFVPAEHALPDPQQEALEVVFGRRAGVAPDPFLVGLATLTVLTDLAARRPLVCVVDDAHWVDDPSLTVLAFVARRLLADPVAMVFATRPAPRTLRLLGGLPQMAIGPLSREAQLALLELHLAGVRPAQAGRMVTESEGNPLALIEYARHSTHDRMTGPEHPADPQPLTARVERLFDAEIVALPPQPRLLLLTAALEPSRSGLLVRRAAERLGVDFGTGPERHLGRLATLDAKVAFAHPLVPSAVHRLATWHERTIVHAALAATHTEDDVLPRAWHLSRATEGRDDAVAAELERAATLSHGRGGYGAESVLLSRAAELTTAPDTRDERIVRSAQAALMADDITRAQALVDEATPYANAGVAARAALVRGKAQLGSGAVVATASLTEAARLLQELDAAAARDAWHHALYAAFIRAGAAETAPFDEVARQALAAGLGLEQRRTFVDLLALGLVHIRVGDRHVGLRLVRDAFATDHLGLTWEVFGLAIVFTFVAAAEAFELEAGRRCLERQLADLQTGGVLLLRKLALGTYATFVAVEGRIAEAIDLLHETEDLHHAVGGDPRWAKSHGFPRALQGRDDGYLADSGLLMERAADTGFGSAVSSARVGRGEWLNAHSRYPEAIAELEPLIAEDSPPYCTWALPTYVEVAVRSGRDAAAREAVARLDERASAAGTARARGLLARSRAQVADAEDAGPLHEQALAHLHQDGLAVDRARAQLLLGEWLRRERRISEAVEQLGAAHDAFATMGAEGYAHRAQLELAAAGGRVRRHVAPETRDELTAREHQVATRAASGATNREIATQMFISEATVAYHLRKVFQKLEITSRRELRTAL